MNQEDNEQAIRDSFAMYDKDGNGSISLGELREVLRNLGEKVTNDDINQIIQIADTDGDGEIDYKEFVDLIKGVMKNKGAQGDQDLRRAFTIFDQDGNGSISASELKIVLDRIGIKMTDYEIANTIREADTDGNGEVDYNEFVNVVTR